MTSVRNHDLNFPNLPVNFAGEVTLLEAKFEGKKSMK